MMIPETRAKALFRQEGINGGRGYCTEKPVVAWDDEGYPMVIDDDRGYLIRANIYSNFETVCRADPPEIVAIMPADGWMITALNGEWSNPLVGWGLKADGEVVPLDVDGTGLVEALEYGHGHRIWHKDHPLDDEAGA